ncbi:hypothetical protein [Pseudonocardia sp. TRM90224]|uniref:hypothetical protein n=1 Tax=Pseudonocardia sp. TRM90224 TaxID=2812678 RepID=UPI001E39E62B|nr:hypothetical protein [Pseudonocardia sp. TRM90224]
MHLDFPDQHTPRYADFEIGGVSDETMREGGERALFGADDARKLLLVEALAAAGIRDIDLGSGIAEPVFLRRCLDAKFVLGRLPAATHFAFNMTLQTWEPLTSALAADVPRDYLADISVSLGMIEIGQSENLLERVHERLAQAGVHRFRASILNAFSGDVDEEQYLFIDEQISRCRQLGIDLVRINDSTGTLLPHATAVLAANLVHDNPDMQFYLHGHDDRGLGTANSLISVMHGFQIVEGGVGGFGNRAGLPLLEALARIFQERGITVATGALDVEGLTKAAAVAEDVFMVVPDVYRPISGMLVENENAGIVNVPDHLGVRRSVEYFLNPIGLFPRTVHQMLTRAGVPTDRLDEDFVERVCGRLRSHMEGAHYQEKRARFTQLLDEIRDFYTGIVRLDDVQRAALEELQTTPRVLDRVTG